MEFNLTTFILEIVNFLALIWVLKVFLYAPVRKGLDERAEKVRGALAEAQAARLDAERLQERYDGRLKTWEEEKAREKEKLQSELETVREKQLALLKASLDQERERFRQTEAQRLAERVEEGTRETLRQAAEFASKLLAQGATAETERSLIEMTLRFLADDGNTQDGWKDPGSPTERILVKSAYPLEGGQRQALEDLLQRRCGRRIPLECRVEPSLLAGLEVTLGSVVLQANLRDELVFFAKAGAP